MGKKEQLRTQKMPQEALHLLRQYQFPVTTTGKAVCSIDGFLL